MMKTFLNFSTILCYVLITVLVISCGGSSGGNGVINVPQPEPKYTNCLLPDRQDQHAVTAALCQGGSFIGLIAKTNPVGQEVQKINFLTPSTETTEEKEGRAWDALTLLAGLLILLIIL